MTEQFKIAYEFRFNGGAVKKFDILLDKETLSMVAEQDMERPKWTELEFHQCSICPLNKTLVFYCPIAENLSRITREFKDITAGDRVSVAVTVKERTYFKETTIQEGLSPLLGIIMATSGCPVMEPLKPMGRFHLPFASLDETVFRVVSMYLVAQFIRDQAGKKPEWRLEGLARIYGEVKKLNKDFGQRMIAAAHNDANVHALVNLNVFAVMVPMVAENMLKEITPYFSSYLK